jgi:hypothetical protein
MPITINNCSDCGKFPTVRTVKAKDAGEGDYDLEIFCWACHTMNGPDVGYSSLWDAAHEWNRWHAEAPSVDQSAESALKVDTWDDIKKKLVKDGKIRDESRRKVMEDGSLEITMYDFQTIDRDPKIVISQVKFLDKNGKYVKFAKLRDVTPYLSKIPVRFKEKEGGENA